ncbi:MAG: hypothetical protein IKW13_05170, partial [Thermoguttaceae bacterium]|nr:hypothetical protein [Thermoguttaceae bacterium]
MENSPQTQTLRLASPVHDSFRVRAIAGMFDAPLEAKTEKVITFETPPSLDEDWRIGLIVGPSGSGKSYRALYVAGLYSIDYIIDDGILISGNKIIAGSSAKLEKTMMSAVRCAVFMDEKKRQEMIDAIKE